MTLGDRLKQLNKQMKDAKGLGDSVAAVTQATNIKPCGGCKKRQEWLNRMVPYKR